MEMQVDSKQYNQHNFALEENPNHSLEGQGIDKEEKRQGQLKPKEHICREAGIRLGLPL